MLVRCTSALARASDGRAPPRWRDATQATAPPPNHLALAACSLAAALVVLLGLPLGIQTFYPPLAGFAWGWASFLLGMPLLSAGLLVACKDAHKGPFLWMVALALPVFILAANLHAELSREVGGEEPVFLFLAQVAPPALLLTGLAGLLRLAVRTGWDRLRPWRQRRHFRAIYH